MFLHIFKYRIKCIFRNRSLLFWTAVFPLILATFYQIAFSNIGNDLKAIPIAIVESKQYHEDTTFKTTIESLSMKDSDEQLFDLTVTELNKANELLDKNKIDGYIFFNQEKINLVIKENDINQSIIKAFLDKYQQTSSTVAHIMTKNPQVNVTKMVGLAHETYTKKNETKSINAMCISYYGLIAMVCLYSSLVGSRELSLIQANISDLGARLHASPFHKMKYFFASLSATVLLQFIQFLILLLYLLIILKINLGNNIAYILLVGFFGTLTGVLLGCLMSALVKKNERAKEGYLTCISMTMCIFSGMMTPDIKYMASEAVPWLQKLNIANLITDSLYSLYFYNDYTRFYSNMGYLCSICAILYIATYTVLRRNKYANI